ncbi:BamA/TamA family outer membrane protein [Kiritimatiellaeota bacterium B1221]|nr:BamA/TamA family outer membrane protein [Kiritimatiellaeota bacterium B1221]
MDFLYKIICFCYLFLAATPVVRSQSRVLLPDQNEDTLQAEFNWLPYGFFSESFGTGLGVGGVLSAWPAEETSVLGAVTIGTTGSYNAALGLNQVRVPGFKRLYISPYVIVGEYVDQILYVGSKNQGYEGQQAGSNDSSPDNFVFADQWDQQIDFEFSYLLPVGDGAGDNVVNTYEVEYGILKDGATGGKSANPLKSGRTTVFVTPAWRRQTLSQEDQEVPLETLNLTLALEWDNRNFPANPSKGGVYKFSYQKDFRDEDALSGWEVIAGDFQWIFDLGANEYTKQRVLAFDFATAYVTNWEEDAEGNITRRPPQYEGATLGGLNRMRGYEANRFHDRAAIYYSAEYRVIPEWQPLREIQLLNFAQIQYWQWTVFVEAGRVSETYDAALFYDDLHVDAGVSLRGMLHTAVLRLDVAVSEEGSRVVAMYGHPF